MRSTGLSIRGGYPPAVLDNQIKIGSELPHIHSLRFTVEASSHKPIIATVEFDFQACAIDLRAVCDDDWLEGPRFFLIRKGHEQPPHSVELIDEQTGRRPMIIAIGVEVVAGKLPRAVVTPWPDLLPGFDLGRLTAGCEPIPWARPGRAWYQDERVCP